MGARRSGGAVGVGLARAGLEAALLFAVLATLVFVAFRALPGDPAAIVLGDHATPEARAALRARLGLDQPLPTQYALFWRGLLTLDLGESLRRPGVSALARVREAALPTAELAFWGVGLGALLGVGAAVLATGPWLGARRVWVERLASAASAVPLLAVAPVLTYALAARLRVVPLPGDPAAGFGGTLFAAGLLAVPLGAHVARVGRAALEDVGRLPFVSTAIAKGSAPWRVHWLHAPPPAAGPLVAVVGAQLGALLGGAVVLERLFERPGLGALVLESYASRDLPVLEAAVLASGMLFVIAQACARAVHVAVDPRARAGEGSGR